MKIIWSNRFTDDIKYYSKKKHYKKIFDDLEPILLELENGTLLGDKLQDIELDEGTAAYKVRVANSSTNSGKSNGYRLIYYVVIDEKIYLLTIYSKKDDNRIPTDSQISMMIKNIIEG